MPSKVQFFVKGTKHLGWLEIAIVRSLEQFASTFDVSFTDVVKEGGERSPIGEGDSVELLIDGKVVLAGYVDDLTVEYSATDFSMTVSGRSKTADLVDCSAVHKGGQWVNAGLLAIAKDLCDPFSVLVESDADLGAPFTSHAIVDGESVFETLERACRLRGVMLTTTRKGALSLAKIGVKRTATVIEYGKNILTGAYAGSWKDRFSDYTIKGDAVGTDASFGKTVSQPVAKTTDDNIDRPRPIILHAESHGTSASLLARVKWERNIRAGRAQRYKYTMAGLTNAEGAWEPNVLARVYDTALNTDAELLIVTVRQTIGADGEVTELELCDPNALTLEPLSPTKPAKKAAF